jgi:putative transcriptional regulator
MKKKNYRGHLLAANPSNPKDDLSQAVILLINQTPLTAIGLQLNFPIEELTLSSISDKIGIAIDDDSPIYRGGNANINKISIIHSTDWKGLSTTTINSDIAVTNDISILAALSRGEGPEYFRACSGHWVWTDGELGEQLKSNNNNVPYKWETIPATINNVFNNNGWSQWHDVLNESAQLTVASWF